MKLNEFDDLDLRLMTKQMYEKGGFINVMECISAMRQCELVVLQKLKELMEEDRKNLNAKS